MANRKRNIQMKFYVTEDEKRLIDEKMSQLPTRRYGAYLRKMAIAMLGFIPIFLPLLIVLVPLIGGIVMMLYYSKVQKFGMVSLTGLICGILMLLTGMGYWSIITGAVFGVLADLVLKSGDYKSAKKGIISHGVFSMWIIGNYIPIVATRDSYYQQLISGYGQEYADSIMSYI